MLILATVVAQRIIVARPLAIGPRLGLLAFTVAARLLSAPPCFLAREISAPNSPVQCLLAGRWAA